MSSKQNKPVNGNRVQFDFCDFERKVDKAAKVISDCTNEHSPDEVFISFNGGKDCTVLLHLYLKNSTHKKKPKVVYIQPDDPFDEMDAFIKSCERAYGVEINFMKGKLKTALEKLCSDHPKLKAVVMGCRRTDPHCENLEVRQYTDPGWPELLRINPLLDWSYKDIWDYIQLNKIEYCKLYDEGYTSIGDKNNTKPNETLIVKNSDGTINYKPAWFLEDDNLERAGRSLLFKSKC